MLGPKDEDDTHRKQQHFGFLQKIYECCDAIFQKAIGSDTVCKGPTSKDPDCIQTALDIAFYGYGSEGVFTVCNAFSDLRMCLDRTFQSCTTKGWYIVNGWELNTANTIEGLYGSLGFACGAGMDSFLKNEQCLVDAFENNFSQLNTCGRDFNKNTKRDIANACRYSKEFCGCYKYVFGSSCNVESAWWSCERVRSYANGFVPYCNIDCTSL